MNVDVENAGCMSRLDDVIVRLEKYRVAVGPESLTEISVAWTRHDYVRLQALAVDALHDLRVRRCHERLPGGDPQQAKILLEVERVIAKELIPDLWSLHGNFDTRQENNIVQSRQWLVVAACASYGWMSRPEDFLRNPDERVPPRWAHGIVKAETEQAAYDVCLQEFDAGRLAGQEPGDVLLNWYVAPLARDAGAELPQDRQKGQAGPAGRTLASSSQVLAPSPRTDVRT